MMVTVSEVKKQIEKIRISDFQIEDMEFRGQKIKYSRLLRDALLCFNNICVFITLYICCTRCI